jgi:ankyrin repeat protein
MHTKVARRSAPREGGLARSPASFDWITQRRSLLKGADVNYEDPKGKTALHHGMEKEFEPRLLKWLADHGASPDIVDSEGISPRLRATRKRDKRFVAALM